MEITDVQQPAATRSKHHTSQQVSVRDGKQTYFVHLDLAAEGALPYAKHVFDHVLTGVHDALRAEMVPVRSAEASASEKVLPLGVPEDIRERINRILEYAGGAWDASWLHGTDAGRAATDQFTADCPVIEKWLEETS